ncbi:MAG: flavin reductase family protein [Sphingomonadales bacterium]|nr:flavin reductase family protein [Sphingomonadales bacterium]
MIEDFQLSMRHLAGAVNVITAGSGEDAAGLTATAVCSLSMTPPRLLVCINRSGATFAALCRSDRFCVNVLGIAAQDIAEAFAGRSGLTGREKFASSDWIVEDGRPPRFAQAISAVHCTVHSLQVVGTHAVVIGDVVQVANRLDQHPLIYQDRAFQTLRALADVTAG